MQWSLLLYFLKIDDTSHFKIISIFFMTFLDLILIAVPLYRLNHLFFFYLFSDNFIRDSAI